MARYCKVVNVIDSHTAGEPTRVVVGGIPFIPGANMQEKKSFLEKEMDFLRRTLILEPRGHNDMFGAVITAPVSPEANFGIIFMDSSGYLDMCGHGSIGAITVALETGMVLTQEPITKVVLDTPSGIVRADAAMKNGKVETVSVHNVSSFLYRRDVEAYVDGLGQVTFDIAFGGNFFIIIKDTQIGLDICPANAHKLSEKAMVLRKWVNDNIEIRHPLLPQINKAGLVEIWGEAKSANTDYQNVVVFGNGQIDRSPCGTGTCAKMAALVARGELRIDEKIVCESIIKTKFSGMALGITKVGNYPGVTPQFSGTAYITSFSNIVIDWDDPLSMGFLVK